LAPGALTGFYRLELLSRYAIVYTLVNFLIYVTFFPAGLSLVLELMYSADGRPQWDVRQVSASIKLGFGESKLERLCPG
jgi:hydroxymethylglutaryl-CoA reductase (NADPH)